ncbi:1577_t:CDS:2, partial [Dentiscutata heterogama]
MVVKTLHCVIVIDAVFNQLFPILGNSTLISPEETPSKWHLSYSWGFPYRFLEGENLSRRKFIHKIGGRKDPLAYYSGMLVNGHQNKKVDPMGGCAISMSSAHAMPPKIFEIHKQYKHRIAMDITAMDSTMTYSYDFFKYNYIIAYGDDNVLSSNCFNDKWNTEKISEYFAQRGISLRTEEETKNSLN